MRTWEEARRTLERAGQLHLLNFWLGLKASEQKALLAQIASVDWASLPGLIEKYVRNKPAAALAKDVRPAPYFGKKGGAGWDRAGMTKVGEDLIRRGKVAAFVVAGGQGSRLGYEGPKGCFGAGAVSSKPLFEIFADNLLGVRDRYGVSVAWYIMTSPMNDGATRSFFSSNGYFGLEREDVKFFPQGVMPSVGMSDGKVLLAGKGEVATNPDGHGGCIRAMHVSGALEDMRRRGVEHVSYFQVDNPVVRVIDPAFLGLHARGPGSSGEMSSKMVLKAGPEEKVGVFCVADGRLEVIEYSDMPAALANERDERGELRFNAGSIAIHVMSVEFLGRLATDPKFELPYHRAEKKVACVNPETGEAVTPTANNAVKLEKFVFDALGLCGGSVVMETDRVEEFAPIKNATGPDSVESSRALQTERAARWLEACGVAVPRTKDGRPDCVLEISARTAGSVEELHGAELPRVIERGARVVV